MSNVVRIVMALAFVFPILFMVTGAFRPNDEAFRYSSNLSISTFLPTRITLEAFESLNQISDYYAQLFNTVLVGICLATSSTLVAVLAAYPLSRRRFRGRDALFFAMLATWFIPFDVIVVPLYLVVRDAGLLDTFWGLILPWVFSPLSVYLMRQVMSDFPLEIEEAALMDGAGLIDVLRYVILPNIVPSLATTWLLSFISVWSWFLWPLMAVQSARGQVIQVGVAMLFNPLSRTNYSLVFAGAFLSTIPVLLAFFLLQRYFTETMVHVGTK